jgi:hypothetical protein
MLARVVRGNLELPLHFGPGETARLELPRTLRVRTLPCLAGLAFFLFAFFHPLGEAGFRVDESFSSVTHIPIIQCRMQNAKCTMPNDKRAPLDLFHPAVREWFSSAFAAPTRPQQLGWPAIARGESTLILAPTGSGKTLAAFLWCLNRLMFEAAPPRKERCRVLYISPLKALAVDVERNLRAPLAGIVNVARTHGTAVTLP